MQKNSWKPSILRDLWLTWRQTSQRAPSSTTTIRVTITVTQILKCLNLRKCCWLLLLLLAAAVAAPRLLRMELFIAAPDCCDWRNWYEMSTCNRNILLLITVRVIKHIYISIILYKFFDIMNEVELKFIRETSIHHGQTRQKICRAKLSTWFFIDFHHLRWLLILLV